MAYSEVGFLRGRKVLFSLRKVPGYMLADRCAMRDEIKNKASNFSVKRILHSSRQGEAHAP